MMSSKKGRQRKTAAAAMFSICGEEPLQNPIHEIAKSEQNLGDTTIHFDSQQVREVFRTVKHQHQQWLQARKASMEADHIREERQLQTLSSEMAQMAREEIVAVKRRQQLHETSIELRELQLELRNARATIMLESQQDSVASSKGGELQASKKEAAELGVRIQQEREAEVNALKAKRAAFRMGLIQQIAEHRRTDVEQAKMLVRDHELMLENQRRLAEEDRRELLDTMNRKMARKQELDEFMMLQKSIKQQNIRVDVHDVGILQSMHETTQDKLHQVYQLRNEGIRKRHELSQIIGAQILDKKAERTRHEELIIDLLVKESKANEDKFYKEMTESEYKKKLTTQQDLLLQRADERLRREKRLYYEKKYRPKIEETSFAQREYRNQDALIERLRSDRMRNCDDIVLMIKERKIRRLEEAEENRQFVADMDKLQDDRDKMVAIERMELLRNEPVKVLAALRNGVLTSEERKELGVKEGVRNRFDYE